MLEVRIFGGGSFRLDGENTWVVYLGGSFRWEVGICVVGGVSGAVWVVVLAWR